jgi:hypothetical protein
MAGRNSTNVAPSLYLRVSDVLRGRALGILAKAQDPIFRTN